MGNPGELNELWATGTGAANTEPPDALQLSGWSASEPPTAAHVNALFERSSRWWRYLTAAMDDASTYFYFKAASTFTSLRLHMVGGVNAWLEIDKATGEFSFQHASGATNCLKVTADGLKGATAVASASTGIRYGYPGSSLHRQTFSLGFEVGGWSPCTTGSMGPIPVIQTGAGTFTSRIGNCGTIGDCFMRTRLNFPAITGQLSGTPIITTFSATFTGAADDLEFKLCRWNKSTGAQTTISTIKSSDPTKSPAHTVDAAAYSYFIQAEAVGGLASLTVTTDGVRTLNLVVDFQDVNSGI